MQKQAPTPARLATMVLFALSCFGLLLFLWLSFGGPVPLQPKGYRIQVAIPEATQLAEQADVRVAGVAIGTIVKKEVAPGPGNRTLATIEIDERYAPLDADARVIQRQKTLLGEKYLEMTLGDGRGPTVPENGRLPDAQVRKAVQLDEILNILDPQTRRLFRTWQQDLGRAVDGRGQDLSDAFGNLPRFTASGTDLLRTLDEQEEAVSLLVANTGRVFEAITRDEGQLRNLVVNTDDVFQATASQQEALADTFKIFPTFLDESRATVVDLESFSRQARPLIRDLRPAIQDLRPTLQDVRALAPDLRDFYVKLDPLITASKEGLPALERTLEGLSPVLARLQPFLEDLNPILEWLEYQQHMTADFFSNGGGALVDTIPTTDTEEERGHYLGQYGLDGEQTVIASGSEPAQSRGNAYPDPTMLIGEKMAKEMINGNWRCDHTGKGEFTTKKGDTDDDPSCWVAKLPGLTRFPHIKAADYSAPAARR